MTWNERRSRCAVLHFLLAVLFGCMGGVAQAQEAGAGTRVRVAAPQFGQHAGLLLAATRDSVLLGFSHLPATPIALARRDISLFELSAGGDGVRSAAVGVQAGLLAGGLLWGIYHLASRKPAPSYHYDRGDLIAASATGAVAGILIGGAMGTLTGQERWDSTGIPSATTTELPPLQDRTVLQTRRRLGLFTSGEPIRVHTTDGRQVTGRFAGVEGTNLHVTGDARDRVPLVGIASIAERRATTGPWMLRGMIAGAAIGLATVGAVYLADDGACAASQSCAQPFGAFTFMFGVGGAFTGAAVGAIAGSYVKRWRPQRW